MATPLSADTLVTALRAEGVTVVEHPGWRNHNRAGHGPWGPVHGVVIHHTVTRGTDATVAMCWDGYDDLPGPLCHGVVDKTGTVHLVGNGRANHAGRGDSDVLSAVIAEDYDQAPPRPTENDTDGNARFYGFECINLGDGEDPWPAEQLDAIERIAAAICRAHSWTTKSVIGHKEWTNTKIDPSFGMPDMRARIAHRLGAQPDGKADTKPATNANGVISAVSVAHLREAARRDPQAAQGHTTHKTEVEYVEHALIAEGLLDATWGDGSFGTKTIAAYAAWQRLLGYTGRDADGIPGHRSLQALGHRYDFDVTD
ncbi:N-acetylmuramoyl-L-alanine amidase [Streptomyces sp. NPDC001339]|uniref:N-acetylmuramoyl-L-alanine amidase n=1 Tax=Streptomyces sp. NPDC001339 TaxID=3364563 RepID=UPI00368E8A61